MTRHSLAEYGAGATFGAALFASGVYSPAVISSQLALTNFHMIKSFMTASAASAVVMHVADRTKYAAMKIRNPQNLGFFTYDGNLLGGAMIGVGMAMTGACPGTVLVQSGIGGLDSGTYALLGGVLGGLAYAVTFPCLERIKKSRELSHDQPPASEAASGTQTVLLTTSECASPTIRATFNVGPFTMLIGWEAICVMVLYLAFIYDPRQGQPQLAGLLSPISGGLAIGAAQAAVVLLTRHSVGCSKAYENIGHFLQGTITSGRIKKSAVQYLARPSTVFAAGIISAAANLASIYPPVVVAMPEASVFPVKAMFGGAVMAYGASMAGGCTSGHGISGLVTFSLASFVSVGAMFGSGIAARFLL